MEAIPKEIVEWFYKLEKQNPEQLAIVRHKRLGECWEMQAHRESNESRRSFCAGESR